jgi:class 3 adenylate cyclase/predicted ATPase
MDVGGWLRSLGLERYEAAFRENEVNERVLPSLTQEDLKEIGVGPVGHRRMLLEAIAALQADKSGNAPSADAATASSASSIFPEDRTERRQFTVMFSDLVGSTALSVRLDPEDLGEIFSAYQNFVAETVGRFGGFVARYMGDGVLVYFGYPLAHEDDAERAVRAGLALVGGLPKLKTVASTTLQARVGIATGLVVVGDLVGEGASRDVVGETPNLAARLQALAEPGTVVISSSTRRLTGGFFNYRDLGTVALKGFAEMVPAWQVLGASAAESRFKARHASTTPLVGRDEEIDLLLRRWEQAKRGEGSVVLLAGEPGIGKSRLIEEFRLTLSDAPHNWVEWNCSQSLQNTALHPVAEWGRQHFSFEEPAERRLAALEAELKQLDLNPDKYLPMLLPPFDISLAPKLMPRDVSPGEYRRRQLDAMIVWLTARARAQPLVLVCEDLHWADPTTVELLGGLVERTASASIFLLMTARLEFQPPWNTTAHRGVLALAPLDDEDVKLMVREITTHHFLSPAIVDNVVAKAGGVPLFVEEVTCLLLEGGQIDGVAAIPPTLREFLTARLDRLGPAREVAQVAAVLGRDFTFRLLREASRIADSRLARALRQLTSSGLLQAEGAPPDAKYRFKHALIRDAAYDGLLRSRRQMLHRHVAETLRDRFPDRAETEPEIVAHHFTAAAEHLEAVAYWQRAGLQALQRFANAEAISHLRKALEELRLATEAPERAAQELSLQVMLAVPLTVTRGWAAPDVEAAYRRAFHLSQQVGETPQLFPALVGLLTYYIVTAQLNTAHEMAKGNLRLAENSGDPELLLEAEHDLASTTFYLGRFDETLQHVSRLRALYDPHKHHGHVHLYGKEPMVVAMVHESLALWCIGRPDAAADKSLASVNHARTWMHPFSYAWALASHAVIRQMRGEVTQMRDTALRAITLSSEQGFPNWLAQGLTYVGWTMTVEGNIEAGIAKMKEGIGIWRMTGARLISCYLMYLLADGLRRGGRFEEALQTLREILQLIEETSDVWWLPEIQRLRGQVILEHTGDCDAAAAIFEQALAGARRQGGRGLELRAATSLARALENSERLDEARAALDHVRSTFTEGLELPDLIEADKLLTRGGPHK